MVLRKAWIPAQGTFSVGSSNEPFNPTEGNVSHTPLSPSEIQTEEAEYENKDAVPVTDFLNAASLANLAHVHQTADGKWNARGDPTEIAIQVFVTRFNWNRLRLTRGETPAWSQAAEFPFDSVLKKMSVIFTRRPETEMDEPKHMVFAKGAVERILESCSSIVWKDGGKPIELTDAIKDQILKHMEALAKQGLRVLALASKEWSTPFGKGRAYDRTEVESDLNFLGLIGLYDPPRPESADAVRRCHQAGISVHMLTGDHLGTAQAIAKQVGILPPQMDISPPSVADAMVMTAAKFDKLSDQELDDLPVLPLVIARCTPSTKVRMIEALHRRGCFASMTGDGVNDSPSLKKADVGIAMGQSGSDVAKNASEIVLTDDNFASILNAIEEGRRVFDNIQKFILHLLAENIAQASTLLIGLAIKDSSGLSVFPLSPVEILWVIMVTSGMPDMGLGMEVAAPDIMDRPPQSLRRGVFTPEVMLDMLAYGLWMAALCLSSFALVMWGFGDGNLGFKCNESYSADCDLVFRARATTFVSLTWFSLLLAWQMVNMRRSFFRMKPGSDRYFTQWIHDVWRNPFLFWAIITGFVTVFLALYIPTVNRVAFKHTGISWEWGVVFVEAFLFILGIEAWKWGKRIYFRRCQGNTLPDGDTEKRAFDPYLSPAITRRYSNSGNKPIAGGTPNRSHNAMRTAI
jgi:Na+-exporting ATPase